MTKYGKCMNIFMQMPGTIFSCFPDEPDGIYYGTLKKMKIACGMDQ